MKWHQITIAIIIVIKLQIKAQENVESNCGKRVVQYTQLITNGFLSNEGDWPWHAAIHHAKNNDFTYKCGGTVLNSNTILTAGHCVYEHNRPIIPERVLVYLGKYHLKYIGTNTKEFQVYKIIPHPNFSISDLRNDIAIIRLSTEATFNNYIQPICLWDSNKMSTSLSISELNEKFGVPTVVGWGATEKNELSPILRHAKMPVVSLLTCLMSNPITFGSLLSQNNFCAGSRNATGACNGDSGGSLSFDVNGVYYIRGIVSLAPADKDTQLCKATEYVLFTDVVKYLPWIEQVVPQLQQSASKSGGYDSINIGKRIGPDEIQTQHGSCLIPEKLPDSLKVYYDADTSIEIPKGSYAKPYSSVIYKCKNKVVEGNTTNLCFEGQWVLDHPDCQIYCSQLSGVTIAASCELFDETISCVQPILPQTIARINCAVGYRKPSRHVIDVINCKSDGNWDYDAFICEPTCGKEAPEVVPYIGGQNRNTNKLPWHVGIYSNVFDKEAFAQICGGTIINAKLVISAAHCFWDVSEDQFYEAAHFKIGAGKYHRNFNDVEPIKAQFRDISSIEHREEYNDYQGEYALDIALLILADHLQFNTYIKPICIEFDLNFNEKFVPFGLVGIVAGWGLDTSGGKASDKLKYIDLSTVTYNQCKKNLTSKYQSLITGGDKFCASYIAEQIICQGDSGGGFFYTKEIGGNKLYFLRGIASSGINKAGSCDDEKFSLFTNIQFHIDMIKHYELKTRPK